MWNSLVSLILWRHLRYITSDISLEHLALKKSSKSRITLIFIILLRLCYVATCEWWNYGPIILFPPLTSSHMTKMWKLSRCKTYSQSPPTIATTCSIRTKKKKKIDSRIAILKFLSFPSPIFLHTFFYKWPLTK